MLSHRNALAFVDWATATFALTPEDRLANHAPFHFDLSTFDLFGAAAAGAALYPVPPRAAPFPAAIARLWCEARLTVWYATPSTLGLLLAHGGLADLDLTALRVLLFAGEVMPVPVLRRLMGDISAATQLLSSLTAGTRSWLAAGRSCTDGRALDGQERSARCASDATNILKMGAIIESDSDSVDETVRNVHVSAIGLRIAASADRPTSGSPATSARSRRRASARRRSPRSSSPSRASRCCGRGRPSDDYGVVRDVIEYLTENWRDQPSLEAIAERIGMEPTRLQKLFTRWAGLSPKPFLQAIDRMSSYQELTRDIKAWRKIISYTPAEKAKAKGKLKMGLTDFRLNVWEKGVGTGGMFGAFAVAGAVVGAAASIVQQGLFIALGYQESFSWKDVAAGAVAGAFSGAAQGLGAAAKAGEVIKHAKTASAALKVAAAASKQLITNGKITSWASLAAAAGAI